MKRKHEVYGKVTFVTQSDGKLCCSQKPGFKNGEEWLCEVLTFAGFLMGAESVERMSARAVKRVRRRLAAQRAKGDGGGE